MIVYTVNGLKYTSLTRVAEYISDLMGYRIYWRYLSNRFRKEGNLLYLRGLKIEKTIRKETGTTELLPVKETRRPLLRYM
jgi:hypothetical protein